MQNLILFVSLNDLSPPPFREGYVCLKSICTVIIAFDSAVSR